jgi:chromodomain-helicase-DNA-binding protein 1
MSSSPEPSLANGHGSPLEDSSISPAADGAQSDSDLSEVNETVVIARPRDSPSAFDHDHDSDDAKPDSESHRAAESSADDNNEVSDDADFDVEDSPVASHSDAAQDELSESNDSHRAAKRKVGAGENEYIAANPELYGLRRSVRGLKNFSLLNLADRNYSLARPSNPKL